MDFKYRKRANNIYIVSYEGDEKNVIVPNEIDGLKVRKICKFTFIGNENIETISFPKDIIIEDNAIVGCENLIKINLENLSSFGNFIEDYDEDLEIVCKDVKTIQKLKKEFGLDICIRTPTSFDFEILPNGTLKLKNLKMSDDVEEFVIPNEYNGAKVTKLANGFFYHTNLKAVTFNDYIEDIPDECFYNCAYLTKVYNMQHIKTIGKEAFAYTNSLKDFPISFKWFERIGDYAFRYSGITKFKAYSRLLDIGTGAFEHSKLEEVSLRNCFLESLKDSTFSNCEELRRIEFNDNMKILGDYCFYGCKRLETLSYFEKIKNVGISCFAFCLKANFTDLSHLKSIKDNAFYYCAKLPFEIKLDVDNLGESAFYCSKGIRNAFVSNKNGDIPTACFKFCPSLANVYCNDNIEVIGDGAFDKSSLNIFKANKIKSIGERAFYDTDIDSFIGNEDLEFIGNNCFGHCLNLRTFDISKTKVTTLNTLVLSEDNFFKVLFPENLKVIGLCAFENSSIQDDLEFPNVEEIKENAFNNAHVKSLTFDKAQTIKTRGFSACFGQNLIFRALKEIGKYAFSSSTFTTISIESEAFDILTIDDSAFEAISSIYINIKSVFSLGNSVFKHSKINKLKINTLFETHLKSKVFFGSCIDELLVDFKDVKILDERCFYTFQTKSNLTLYPEVIKSEVFYNSTIPKVQLLGDISTLGLHNFEGDYINIGEVSFKDKKALKKLLNRNYFKNIPKDELFIK